MLEIIYIFIFVLFLYAYNEKNKANKGLLELKQNEPDFTKAVDEFEYFLDGSKYFNNRKYENWSKKYQYLQEGIDFNFSKVTVEKEFKEIILKYLKYKNNTRIIIDDYNEKFIEKESERIIALLDERGIESDGDQRKSIVCEEDCTLIVAGAGTGKTQTILGKVAFLCLDQKILPEEILLLSFTRKATQELKIRTNQISNELDVGTFNSFGFSIIGKVLGEKPSVAFGDEGLYQKFINKLFNARLESDCDFLSLAIDYFLYYLHPIELYSRYETKDEYYKSLRAGNILTIKKEKVKSIQEAMIANFLFTHKIDYEYEREYEYKTSNKEHYQYKPDFYLSDYGIYLEHFGIDRKGNTHFTNNKEQNKIDSKKYNADMEVKRDFHSQYKTNLIETYSYEFFEGNWKEKLIEKLQRFGVELEKRPESEILREIKKGEYIRLITPLICTFLNLMKSRNFSIEDIKNKFEKNKDERGTAFMKIFEDIYEEYSQYLKDNNKVDFNDMLLQATNYIRENKYIHNYKYIIIDEFQDFSFSKYRLICAMLEQNLNTKLFCVGDDWQSIYRFAGSDVNLMLNFEKYFGFTKMLLLEKCHRFNNQLAEITNDFILINQHQLKKKLYSDVQAENDSLQVKFKKNDEDKKPLRDTLDYINEIARKNNAIASVFLLGRYNFNKLKEMDYEHWRFVKVEFMTVHLAKGLTCDYAIILNNETGKYGFPSEFADDPLINAVLSEIDPSPHSEERRLMYVAMTRARNQVFLLAQQKNKSLFVRELEKKNQSENNTNLCPKCGGEMVAKTGPYSSFYGCSNFPYCKYTKKIEQSYVND